MKKYLIISICSFIFSNCFVLVRVTEGPQLILGTLDARQEYCTSWMRHQCIIEHHACTHSQSLSEKCVTDVRTRSVGLKRMFCCSLLSDRECICSFNGTNNSVIFFSDCGNASWCTKFLLDIQLQLISVSRQQYLFKSKL